ncbi:hypothetical protein NPIL_19681 [Nephila pilipes]|uniref:Uncharacterized protein n=1 Tax=Nephila pilipes TaxID=299642 RepID=A0A8X6U3C1_NEPPI|nr:hypothetical protein NPIL_19681 [Nephila pilipes]
MKPYKTKCKIIPSNFPGEGIIFRLGTRATLEDRVENGNLGLSRKADGKADSGLITPPAGGGMNELISEETQKNINY